MDCIADNLHSEESQGHSASKEYQLIFVSRRSAVCEQRLKDKGVYGTLTSIDELPVDFFPLDSDVISMELDNVFKTVIPPMSPLFDTLMIIDRTVDLITPVVTQLTYEGLIDEFYGIIHNTVKLPGENFQASSHAGQSPRSDGTRTFQPWVLHSVAKLKLFQLSSLDNAIVAFGGVKVSAFARDSGEIFLDSFDDSVIMINPDIPDERELREWLKDNQ
ncbi:hypothetical protein DAPPUDRAFT_120082 [Daphnia pulex]|uniref:Uncharacterized protein n=1 Tax=Daphnia pulex TaxID=6669 RepID=E9I083_DAPPU|nr:hypothetical protein DAPPUDRAFT_120082 [Daphnia pulex]|eukprot:EFX62598.1 hypothetical protein DAPPUDRAFT_120082 [Daphnia pulex]